MSVVPGSSVDPSGDPTQGGHGLWAWRRGCMELVGAMKGSGGGKAPSPFVPILQLSHAEGQAGSPCHYAIAFCAQ